MRPEEAPKPKRATSPEKGLVRPEEAPKLAASPEKGLVKPNEAPKRAASPEKGLVRAEEAPKRAESRQPDSARFSVHNGGSVPYIGTESQPIASMRLKPNPIAFLIFWAAFYASRAR
ncbi:hypothetical protein J31TS3_06800 [Paenibacillus lactis]|nr:hypothetical protein J31TS3_06800 [Paenibacillus lactis]